MASQESGTHDLTFVKRRHTKGPNDWAGAWMTRQEAKQFRNDLKANRAARQAANPLKTVPGVPGGAPATASYTLGTGVQQVPLAQNFQTSLAAVQGQRPEDTPPVPSWWIGQAYVNPTDPNQQFANVANALLPTLAPEDQRTLAGYLATNFKDVFGGYANTKFGAAPTEITDDIRKQFLNPQRAQLALSLLDKMKAASGAQNMGTGYDFLKNAVNLINQFTVDGALTRERYGQFNNAVSSLVQGAGKDMSAYANLAQLFNLPQFSAGPLVSNAPNARLFG